MGSNHARAMRLDRTARQPYFKNYYDKKKSPATGKANIALTRKFLGMGRLGTADELASAAVFLASDESSFITGIDLPVDGGTVSR
jgi:NAD(P)-dependent dehydrogenase (short-subunit alcohol dehydrogenase family)